MLRSVGIALTVTIISELITRVVRGRRRRGDLALKIVFGMAVRQCIHGTVIMAHRNQVMRSSPGRRSRGDRARRAITAIIGTALIPIPFFIEQDRGGRGYKLADVCAGHRTIHSVGVALARGIIRAEVDAFAFDVGIERALRGIEGGRGGSAGDVSGVEYPVAGNAIA